MGESHIEVLALLEACKAGLKALEEVQFGFANDFGNQATREQMESEHLWSEEVHAMRRAIENMERAIL